jgi:hypothetical protein
MSGTENITWKLTGKGTGGQCEHCPRQLVTHYEVTSSDGRKMTVGRGCLKKVTGWTVTAAEAERMIRQAAREARWQAWCAASPEQAAVVTAGTDRETQEIREHRRQVAGLAWEVRNAIAGNEFGWQHLLASYLKGGMR